MRQILCSRVECTNHVVKGGVYIKHGVQRKIKRCSKERCTNQVQKRGVCCRAYHNTNDESAAMNQNLIYYFDSILTQ